MPSHKYSNPNSLELSAIRSSALACCARIFCAYANTSSKANAFARPEALPSLMAFMHSRHRKTLAAIFARPTSASIVFTDIEALIKALGGSVSEREGSRVRIELNGEQ